MSNDPKDAGGARDKSEAKTEAADVNSRGYRERVFEIVRRIPEARVMTYGQLAEILGEGYTARTVGFVMHSADPSVPWQRVINAQGACSTGRVIVPPDLQQRMLISEGVIFNEKGRCDLSRYRWTPEEYEAGGEVGGGEQPSLFGD
ncbi:MAG TPA: MGMT family protein [Pyrinomonadaceae bacterium]|jgi:methylated-DNA-protein-cysteine methyltransferase-like protein